MKSAHWLPALLPLLAPALAHAGLQYEVQTLGTGRIQQGRITGLNNLGVAVGTYTPLGGQAATSFIAQNGALSPLPDSFQPAAINDHGVIAGTAKVQGLVNAATYDNGTVASLGNLGYDYNGYASQASAINNAGLVVGSARQPYGMSTGVLFTGGQIINIGKLTGGAHSRVSDVNESGLIVGEQVTSGHQHAFVYANGVATDLGTLGGSASGASAVNNRGDIAGYSNTATDNNYHVFLYSNGQMHDLGLPSGAEQAAAIGINDHGTIIGTGWSLGKSLMPFIYSEGAMHDATDLLVDTRWSVKEVHAINDNDQIAATVCRGWGDCTLAVLSPVPEPATYGMLLAGLGVVGIARRRRAQAA